MTLFSVQGSADKDESGRFSAQEMPGIRAATSRVLRATLAIALVWLLLVVALGWWLSQAAVRDELDRVAASAEYEALTTARIVDRLFIEMTSVANMVARQGQVIDLASRYRVDRPGLDALSREERAEIFTSDPLVRSVGDYMTGLANDLHYARIYMNNLSFDTVTSSHWDDEFNIVGQIYTGRAYLLDALNEGRGQMFGIARLNQMPSYFVASRIEGRTGQPLGSITVRLDAPEVAQYLGGRHIALVVNQQGRVTTTSDERFVLRNVAALLPPETVEKTDKDEGPGEPLEISALSEAEGTDQWLVEGQPYLLRSQNLKDSQYQLLTLVALDHLEPMQRQHAWIAGFIALAGLAVITLCGVVAGQHAVRRQEERHAANFDALTGLPNRRLVLSELDRFFAIAKRAQQSVLVAFIDLDGFKAINDTYGHETGDRFLAEVSRRLQSGLRSGDMLGRWGGDEFIVIGISSPAQANEADKAAEMMRNRLAPLLIGTYGLAGRVVEYSGASFGIVCVDPTTNTPQSAVMQADKLMYANKQARRAQQVPAENSNQTEQSVSRRA